MIVHVPRMLGDRANGAGDDSCVAALSAVLSQTVQQWADFNSRWPGVRGTRRATTPRRAAQILRYLDRVFRELGAQFESLLEAFSEAASDCPEPPGAAARHAFFRHARELPRAVCFTPVAFPPHLKASAPNYPDAVAHVPISDVLGESLRFSEAETIDSAFSALAEDLLDILDIVLHRHADMPSEENALRELWCLADHSERHCDMAREAVAAAIARLG